MLKFLDLYFILNNHFYNIKIYFTYIIYITEIINYIILIYFY